MRTDATRSVDVNLFSLAFSAGVSIQASTATATIGDDNSVDEAFLGPNTDIHSTGTAITVTANRGASATSQSDGGAGALLGSGADLEATSSIKGNINAYVDNGAKVGTNANRASGIGLTAEDLGSNAAAETTVGSGAIGFTAGAAKSDATASPKVKAWIGNDVNMVFQDGSGHDVGVTALIDDAEADASASAYGGSLGIRIGAPSAIATTNPVAYAWIGTGTTIVAGGSVKVDAESKSLASGPPLTDNIVGMTNNSGSSSGDTSNCSTDPNTICFIKHGLVSGDSVFYYPNGGGTIGGLHADQTVCVPSSYQPNGSCTQTKTGHVYNVIVVDGNTVRLGDTFTGASAYDGNTGDAAYGVDSVKSGVFGIDVNRSMVRFSSPHGLESGDAVIYRTAGASISNGFANGALLFVRVIDDHTIELYTSQSDATAAPFFFSAGSVCDPGSGCANQIVNSSLADGTRVTYKNADPIIFDAGSVNADYCHNILCGNDGHILSPNEIGSDHRIYLGSGDGGFSEGEALIYQVSDNANKIGGLTDGNTYFVHVVDNWTIQLAGTYCTAVGYSGDNRCTSDPTDTDPSKRINRNVIAITRPPTFDPTPAADPTSDDHTCGSAAHRSCTQALRPAPIYGLTDGFTYVVDRIDGTHIALQGVGTLSPYYNDPNSAKGARSTVGGDNNPDDIFGGSTQALFLAGAALKVSTGCGTGSTPCAEELDIRLTGTLDTANQLLNVDTSSLRGAHPPVGDGKSSASGTGGGGSIGDVSEPEATVNISPSLKAYVAAKTVTIGGDLWITTNLKTNTSANTENGSGGVVSIPSVDSEISGTDNNTAGIGDFSGISGIDGSDPSAKSAKVDASGVTINAGGNIKIQADSSLNSYAHANSDSGGGFDDSNADAHINFTDNTSVAIGKNANVTGLTLAMNAATGGSNHANAHSVVIALFGGSSASPTVNITSNNVALLDGENTGSAVSNGQITALNGIDVRAHHESLKLIADGGHLCICIDVHFGSDGDRPTASSPISHPGTRA